MSEHQIEIAFHRFFVLVFFFFQFVASNEAQKLTNDLTPKLTSMSMTWSNNKKTSQIYTFNNFEESRRIFRQRGVSFSENADIIKTGNLYCEIGILLHLIGIVNEILTREKGRDLTQQYDKHP